MTRRPERNGSSRCWRLCTFRDAARGLKILLITQPNARVHLIAGLAAITLGAFLRLALWEWAILSLAIGGVWIAEALNTAIEFTVDRISPDHHELAGWAKDVAAGAVLVASFMALVIGAILFVPKIAQYLSPTG